MKKNNRILSFVLIFFMAFLFVFAPYERTDAATVKLNKEALQLVPKQSYTLNLSGTNKKTNWISSNPKVATVNSKGKVTAKKAGEAIITAKTDIKQYKCKVLVYSKGKIIPIEKNNQIFLGKVYKETWVHPSMGKETAYILRLVKPIKYRNELGTIRTVNEIHLFSQKNYSSYINKFVFVKGFTVSPLSQWYRRELCLFPDKIY